MSLYSEEESGSYARKLRLQGMIQATYADYSMEYAHRG